MPWFGVQRLVNWSGGVQRDLLNKSSAEENAARRHRNDAVDLHRIFLPLVENKKRCGIHSQPTPTNDPVHFGKLNGLDRKRSRKIGNDVTFSSCPEYEIVRAKLSTGGEEKLGLLFLGSHLADYTMRPTRRKPTYRSAATG